MIQLQMTLIGILGIPMSLAVFALGAFLYWRGFPRIAVVLCISPPIAVALGQLFAIAADLCAPEEFATSSPFYTPGKHENLAGYAGLAYFGLHGLAFLSSIPFIYKWHGAAPKGPLSLAISILLLALAIATGTGVYWLVKQYHVY
jgi:hypothetical protein